MKYLPFVVQSLCICGVALGCGGEDDDGGGFDSSARIVTVGGDWFGSEEAVTSESFVSACTGDLSNDLMVNGGDLAVLLNNWGPSGSGSDITGDGLVDGADLAILLANWGGCEGEAGGGALAAFREAGGGDAISGAGNRLAIGVKSPNMDHAVARGAGATKGRRQHPHFDVPFDRARRHADTIRKFLPRHGVSTLLITRT